MSQQSVPFQFVSDLAFQFGAVECSWRESDRSFTGFVAECWFSALPADFSRRWAEVVGYSISVRCVSEGPAPFVASVPVVVPGGSVWLEGGQRGGRSRVRLERDED